MSALHFDEPSHTYTYVDDDGNERVLPSVTQVISPIVDYSMVPEARLAFARDRGGAVHLACHLDDGGTLDEASVDEEHVLPYLKAWRLFREQHEAEVVVSERPMHYKAMWAGTPDRYLRVKRGRARRFAVVDIKTVVAMTPAIGVQLTGYDLLIKEALTTCPDELLGVQLLRDGTYRVHAYEREIPTFLSLVSLHNWRVRHGSLK